MKANELRIGNYFKFGELIHEATHWDIRNLRISELKNKPTDAYQPIPITEEWLVRSGFKYDEIMYLQHFKSRNGEKLYIGLSKCRIGWSLHLTTFNNQITNFEYFHDLQNFIFSLTGKELKFNN